MLKIELTEEQVQRTLNVLAEQPLKEVFDLVVAFKEQADKQLQEIENEKMAEQEAYFDFLRAKELEKEIDEPGFVDLEGK